jgi:hypothetical protein
VQVRETEPIIMAVVLLYSGDVEPSSVVIVRGFLLSL